MKLTDVKQFHDDLKAAVIARAPIEIGETSGSRTGKLTIAKLDHLERLVLPHLSKENSDGANPGDSIEKTALDQAFNSDPELPKRYRAALHTFDRTGSMVPVLEGFSAKGIAEAQVSRVMQRALLYLVLLLAVAFWGLSIFKSRIIPQIDDLRADISNAAGTMAPERFDANLWLSWVVPVVGCGLLLLVVWMLLGGAFKISMWLGGNYYVRCRTLTSAIRIMQRLLEAGLSVDEAISMSCDLTGADAKARRDIQAAVQDPPDAQHLKSLAGFSMISANQRLAYLTATAPTALVCWVGGGVALVYCLMLFVPLVTLLRDLSMVGI